MRAITERSRYSSLGLVTIALVTAACSSDGSGGMIGAGDMVSVDPTGGGDFTTVQEAVQNAAPGSTIEVGPGNYVEQVVVDKNLRIVGAGAGTVLRAQGASQAWPDDSSDDSSAVLEIRGARGVVVENMTFSGPEDGIKIINSTDITVRNVDASGNGDEGIDVRNSSDVTISGTFSGNGDKGVLVREGSANVVVDSSQMTQNADNGLRFRDAVDCAARGNNASENGDDGLLVRDSSGASISGNTANDNLGYGIRVRNSPTTVLENNQTAGNSEGSVRTD